MGRYERDAVAPAVGAARGSRYQLCRWAYRWTSLAGLAPGQAPAPTLWVGVVGAVVVWVLVVVVV